LRATPVGHVVARLWAQSEACTPTLRAASTRRPSGFGRRCAAAARRRARMPDERCCIAAIEGRQAELPGRKAKRIRGSREATLLIARAAAKERSRVLVGAGRVWGCGTGLWSPAVRDEFAGSTGAGAKSASLASSRGAGARAIHHAFTHFDLLRIPWWYGAAEWAVHEGDDRLWYPPRQSAAGGIAPAIRQLFERLRGRRRRRRRRRRLA